MSMQKKLPKLSPGAAKVAGVSLVSLVAVGAIVLIAHQASPSVNAAPTPAPKAVAPTVSSSAAPAGKAASAKAKTANGAGSAVIHETVTLTGCLEQDHDAFRLKDTTGEEAPKSRSWKTLGLTKHSSSVTIVDNANRLKLKNHVGERVSVTGALVDKDLQGKTLHRVAASCE
jgi:hypothetical protein